jgi:hypothetical protein
MAGGVHKSYGIVCPVLSSPAVGGGMVPLTIGREERDDVGTVPIVGNGGRRPPTLRLGALTMALEVKAVALACACQIRSHLINAKMTSSFVRRCRHRMPPRHD